MQPLRATDPPWVGRHRVLHRLGAGGMGVVYLARSPGGALLAVKVIRAGYADDSGFRARFRREVEVAGRVRSPWVVPLVDADPDAALPWLAAAFVPGPTLADVVEECGPLPPAPARRLGARLAEALDAVHEAGLVHRDVKPGNVLIAHDGPRLIDFGIAREAEDTALTATGMVVGSPGFLSPEQARGSGGQIGPPSDVFSLGCLLAYAVTGVRPFGEGSPAGMLARTVYDEPDLDGVPTGLTSLLRACLEKDPGSRPTAAEVRRTLTAPDPRQGEAWPPAPQPQKDDARPSPPESLTDDARPSPPQPLTGDAWLPEPVMRLIAHRSAAVLALPAVEATEASAGLGRAAGGPTPESTTPAPTGTAAPPAGITAPSARYTRRRFLVLGSAAGVVSAGGTAAWWTAHRGQGTPSSGTAAKTPRLTIAVQADLTGPHQAAGIAQRDGVLLAVDAFNSRAGRPFLLDLRIHDDAGQTKRAVAIAEQLAADDRIRAVIGPTTDACATAVHRTYQEAQVPTLWVSVGESTTELPASSVTTREAVPTNPSDAALAAPLVACINRLPGARRAMLIDDRTEGTFGSVVCSYAAEGLRSAGSVAPVAGTLAADGDFSALATRITDSHVDAVVFTGGPERTARLARALRTAGYSGARLATQRALAPAFLRGADRLATEGWLFATVFVDPAAVSAAKPFVTAYRKRFRSASPPWYAAEAYDAALFAITAMAALGPSGAARAAVLNQLRDTEYRGITKTLRYSTTTTYVRDEDALYLFRSTNGRFRFLGHYRSARSPG
ncbi:ABC transporter substrate-binding protein [Streptomyces sp. NPDC014006]|uniref:bifunctional serine/threonine-protein kinase/ABC transporter substrate-binding protein n=1 Tax=Streptomyces sp. NPDC014006 TaxID=3364870 RepID=UPI0036FFCD11